MASSGGAESYAYSADGMRQKKVSGGATVHYVRDGENVLVETDGTLATVAQHTDLPGMWGGKFAQRRSGASRFTVPDFQGNTRALLDATAAVTDTLTTDAWGVELARTGVTVDPFLAFGQWGYYRDASSRVYVRARHLRTDLGRWVSRDPIGFGGGDWNLYGYVGNAPAMGRDPDGQQGMTPRRGPTKPPSKPTPNKGVCGPEIGHALRQVLIGIGEDFRKKSIGKRRDCCNSLGDYRFFNAWDIGALHNVEVNLLPIYRSRFGCCTGPCQGMVSVDGQCHQAWVVNYVLIGYLTRLCHDLVGPCQGSVSVGVGAPGQTCEYNWELGNVERGICAWKWANATFYWWGGYRYGDSGPAIDWARAGWNHWLEHQSPTPRGDARCAPCHIPSQYRVTPDDLGWPGEAGFLRC